jgi:probable biosynthetic protein (TIGR04099 family)
LAGLAASFRSRRISRHFGFDLSGAADTGAGYSFDPCPAQDFNGAGFLYFTSFLGFVDRAEWQHSPSLEKPIQEREAYYYSNVDAGERLRVVLAAARPSYRWWQVFSEGPDTLLADVFTRRTSDGTA